MHFENIHCCVAVVIHAPKHETNIMNLFTRFTVRVVAWGIDFEVYPMHELRLCIPPSCLSLKLYQVIEGSILVLLNHHSIITVIISKENKTRFPIFPVFQNITFPNYTFLYKHLTEKT